MKVAINILTENPLYPTGALQYYQHLVAELVDLAPNDEFFLFVSEGLRTFFRRESPNLQFIKFPSSNESRSKRILTEHVRFPSVLRKLGIDVFNCGNIAPLVVPCALVATVKTMHAYTNPKSMTWSGRRYRKVLGRRTVNRAEVVLANSQSNKDDIERYFGIESDKIETAFEAVNHDIFKPADEPSGSRPHQRPYILFVSSLWRYKNAESLIRAFARFRDALPDHDLLFVGHPRDQGYTHGLQREVISLSLQERIRFCGGLEHRETAVLYQHADVFVYPSLYETFGLTILEAMACGCPVVTSNVSSMPEIAGGAAELVSPTDVEGLANAIVRVVTDSGLAKAMRKRGLSRAADFTWRRTAETTYAAYEKALDSYRSQCSA